MSNLPAKKFIRRTLSSLLTLCLAVSGILTGWSFTSYGEEGSSEHSVTISMDTVLKTLVKTDGEGKGVHLEKLPEELQAELEGAVIVETGSAQGLRYYITADLMGPVDPENPSDNLLGLSMIFVNQDGKKAEKIPSIQIVNNDARYFSPPVEPEQIWEADMEEDGADGATPADAGIARADSRSVRAEVSKSSPSNSSGEAAIKTAAGSQAKKAGTATPASAHAASPSSATPGNADKPDIDAWTVTPMSAKRIFLRLQSRASETCRFLTDVRVSTADGGSVTDAPIAIDKLVLIEWNYRIPDGGGVVPNTAYTFDIPDVFEFDNLSFELIDEVTGQAIGQVLLNGLNGTLTFNDAARITGNLAPGRTGMFSAKAGINKDQAGNGGIIEVPFPLTVTGQVAVWFPIIPIEADVKLNKRSVLNSQTNKIRWTIEVNPQFKNAKEEDKTLHSLVIHDTLEPGEGLLLAGGDAAGMNLVVESTDHAAVNGGVLEVDPGKKGFTYRFPPNTPGNTSYTVSYDTSFDLNSWRDASTDTLTFHNTANREFSYFNYVLDDVSKKAVKSSVATEMTGTEQTKAKADRKVSGKFVTKTGQKSAGEDTIEWTLTINANKFHMTNAVVKDTITAASKETPPDGNHIRFTDIKISTDGGNTYQPAAGDQVTKTEGKKESSFTLELGPISDLIMVKYTTNIDPSFRQSNDKTEFKNAVLLTINDSIGIRGTGVSIQAGNHLLSKSGTYHPETHIIDWTIRVNEGNLPLTDAQVTDTLPDGLTLVGSSHDIRTTSGSAAFDGQTITVTYPSPLQTEDTIRFQTMVDDPDIWAVNNSGKTFTNTARITAGGMTQSHYDQSGSVKAASNVLEKKGIGYDAGTKRAKWELTVNQNKMQMTNAVITDVIPEGQGFADHGIIDRSFTGDTDIIHDYTYDPNSRRLVISLVSPISSQKTIQYETELTDLSILETNGQVKVSNSAGLSCGEMSGSISEAVDAADQEVSKSIVTKKGVPNGSKGIITWTVELNQNRVPIVNPVLTDDLDSNLALVTDSIKLIRIDTDGNELPESVDPSSISYQGNRFVFSFNRTIHDAYRLEFDTYFKVDGNYGNAVDLTGNNGTLRLNGISGNVHAQYASGSGGTRPTNAGKIRIRKTEEGTGSPIQGVTFTLIKGSVSQTAVTDASGTAAFTDLWPGDYTLKETAAPDEYFFDPDAEQTVTLVNGNTSWKELTITNQRKHGITAIKRDSETGALLAGAEIRVENKTDPTTYSVKRTNSLGEAFFGDLTQGSYTVTETAPPPGYHLSTVAHEVNLTPGVDHLQVEFLNQPMKGTLEVQKVSAGTGAPLSGARIALYTKSGIKLDSAVSGSDGILRFEQLTYGDYDLVEEEAPDGYVLDSAHRPSYFHISSDGQTVTQRFENQKTPAANSHSGGSGGGGSSSSGPLTSANAADTLKGPGTELPSPEAPRPPVPELPAEAELARLQEKLPGGTYKIYTLDENGLVLSEQTFLIPDDAIAKGSRRGLPKTGDRKPTSALWIAVMISSLTGLLLLRRKKRETK